MIAEKPLPPTRTATATQAQVRVFLSYSRSEQARVEGLVLLLEALGHEVFLDKTTIKPGMRWEETLREGLEQAGVLLVYWTKRAAASEWVRKEYEYFLAHCEDRLLVPLLGDETPLSELLKTRQHSDFASLVNELLAMKRTLEKQGVGRKQVQRALLDRLAEAGIELDENQRKKVFRLFAPVGLLGLLTTPLLFLKGLGAAGLETTAQFTAAQAVMVGTAAVSGAIFYGVMDAPADVVPVSGGGTEQVDGHLQLSGVLTPEGQGLSPTWKVYGAPNTLGDRTEVATMGYSADARFILPEGRYLVRGQADHASTEAEVIVAAGDTTMTQLRFTGRPDDAAN